MSSIWSGATSQAGESPFATGGVGPTPGGNAAAKFQSILQASGKQHQSPGQLGLSPAASSRANVARAMASGSGSSGSSNSDTSDATISANDFLTLLVTEMQNQDPTADTDPNEYINQLVQINSLEQLIDINQNLSDVLGASSSPSSQSSGNVEGATGSGARASARPHAATTKTSAAADGRHAAHGNLTAPPDAPAAHKVAHALDGRHRSAANGHALRDIPTRALP